MTRLARHILLSIAALFITAACAQAQSFSLDQNSVNLNGNAGGQNVSDTVKLTNNLSTSYGLTFNISTNSGGNWLSASASPNPVGNKGTSTITIVGNPSKLPPATYKGTVTVTGGGTSTNISVTFTTSGVSISAAPNSVFIPALAVGKQQSTSIHINGSANVQVNASTNQGSGWLQVSSNNVSAPGDFNVTVDGTFLTGGNSYSGTVTLQCVGGSPCVPVSIAVNVTVASANLIITTQNLPPGNVNSSYTFTLGASGGTAPYTWSITGVAPPGLTFSPGGVLSGIPTVVAQTIFFRFTAVVQDNAGKTASVPLTLQVFGVPSLTVSPPQLNLAAQAGTTAQGQQVRIQLNTIDDVKVKADPSYQKGTGWLIANASASSLDYTVGANASTLSPDTYTATLTISCLAQTCNQSPAQVKVTLVVNASSVPSISPNGIITASDFGAFSSGAPGTFIEIYGSNLASTNPGRSWAGQDFTNNGSVAPTSLDGTEVTIDGRKAFVQYVSPEHVNALVPSDVGTGQVQVSLKSSTGTSNSYTLAVNQVQPGMLAPGSFRIGGKQYVAAFLPPDYRGSFAIPAGAIAGVSSRPAKPGDTIVIYAMGLGPVNPAIPAGTLVSGANTMTLPLQIFFGSAQANVAYNGLAPNFTGLYQLNLVVPDVPDNDAVPLTFKVNGIPGSQTLYIAVRH